MVKDQAAVAVVAVAGVSIALVSGCTAWSGEPGPEPTAEFSVTPAVWADYKREKLTPADCPDFAADAAQELLGSKDQPWVFDVIRDVTAGGQTGRFQCSFSDPSKLGNQVAYQISRIEKLPLVGKYPPLVLAMMHRLKTQSPLNARYPGFGRTTTVGKYGGQTAMWACGNQWMSVSVQRNGAEQEDQSALLWKHLEPAVQRNCGTLDRPVAPLGFDKDAAGQKTTMRANVVREFLRAKNSDVTTPDSASAGQEQRTVDKDGVVKSSGHAESTKECAMFSETEAVSVLGLEDQRYFDHGLTHTVLPIFGRGGECIVTIGDRHVRNPPVRIGARFTKYSIDDEVETEFLESIAAAQADPAVRGPYLGKYRGMGMIGDGRRSKQRVATWLCGGYRVEGKLDPFGNNVHIADADLWALTEPTIRRVCGRPDEPMTPPLGRDLRRVDYTQLLMEDWKIGTGSQLMSPPEKKRYVRPGPGATRSG